MNDAADVLIIGGGAAGLAAAGQLTRAGLRITLLEARDRLGGRILTRHHAGYPVELGAEFVHGRPEEIFGLAAAAAVPIVPVEGEFRRKSCGSLDGSLDGSWDEAGHLMGEVEKLFAKLPNDELDQSFQHYLDRSGASEEVKQQASRYVQGFHAADASLISVLSILRDYQAQEADDGDRQFRIPTGYDHLVRGMAERMERSRADVILNSVVKEIVWQPGEAVVRTADEEFRAERAIITLPLGVLRAHSVVFSPALKEKQHAMQFLEMGPVIRVSLCCKEKFWEQQKEMADLGFLFTDDPQFPTWWTSNPLPYPILTGWAAGPCALQLKGLGTPAIIDQAVQSLARITGVDMRSLQAQITGAYTHDWQADPFSRGGYSYAAVGGIDAARALGAPVAETLYFAGEATDSDGRNGTVHGAIASGARAAREVLQSAGTRAQRIG
jgi:monoamine oxidase